MKKLVAVLLSVGMFAMSASALDMSAGGLVGFGLGSYNAKATASGVEIKSEESDTMINVGAYFDATYVMATVQYSMNTGMKQKGTMTIDGVGSDTQESSYSVSGGALSFAVLGKYPFAVGSVSIAPLFGFEYTSLLSYKLEGNDATDSAKDYFNRLWLKGGVCADFNVGPVYIRPIATIGYGLENKYDKDAKDALSGTTVSITPLKYEFAVAVGYKF